MQQQPPRGRFFAELSQKEQRDILRKLSASLTEVGLSELVKLRLIKKRVINLR